MFYCTWMLQCFKISKLQMCAMCIYHQISKFFAIAPNSNILSREETRNKMTFVATFNMFAWQLAEREKNGFQMNHHLLTITEMMKFNIGQSPKRNHKRCSQLYLIFDVNRTRQHKNKLSFQLNRLFPNSTDQNVGYQQNSCLYLRRECFIGLGWSQPERRTEKCNNR